MEILVHLLFLFLGFPVDLVLTKSLEDYPVILKADMQAFGDPIYGALDLLLVTPLVDGRYEYKKYSRHYCAEYCIAHTTPPKIVFMIKAATTPTVPANKSPAVSFLSSSPV